jgi:hypothetical protein
MSLLAETGCDWAGAVVCSVFFIVLGAIICFYIYCDSKFSSK